MAKMDLGSMKLNDFARTISSCQAATTSELAVLQNTVIKMSQQMQSQKRTLWKKGGKSRI